MSGSELIIPEEIRSRIYTIRGLQVMIDRDLASLYDVETRTLNQAVKRNTERFPDDFMFKLSEKEYNLLRSQNATIEDRHGQHRKYLPHAFTPKQWIEKTTAIGFICKVRRYWSTCGVAKCDTFKAVSGQQAVVHLTQVSWVHNIAIIPKYGTLKTVKLA